MKKKFNILALLMVTIMAITLVGCGSKDDDTNDKKNTKETIEDAAESTVDVIDDDKDDDKGFDNEIIDDEKQPTDDDNHDITEPVETEPEVITSFTMNNFTYNIPEGYEIVNQSATEITLTNPDVPYMTIIVSNDNTDALAALYANREAVNTHITNQTGYYCRQINKDYTEPTIDDIFASVDVNELPVTLFAFDGNNMHTWAEAANYDCIYYSFYNMPSLDTLTNLVPLDDEDTIIETTEIIYYPIHSVTNNTIITSDEAVTIRFIIDPYESITYSGNYAVPMEISRVANDLMLYMAN